MGLPALPAAHRVASTAGHADAPYHAVDCAFVPRAVPTIVYPPQGITRQPRCRPYVPGRAANFGNAALSYRRRAKIFITNKIPSLQKNSNAALRQRWEPIATTGHVHQPRGPLNRRLPCAGTRGPSKHPRAAAGCRWRPRRGVPP